jgi:intracellular multiplication protein IcmP
MSTPPAKQAGPDNGSDPVWILIVVGLTIVLFLIVWMAAHTLIATLYGWVRLAQFAVFKLIHTRWAALFGLILATAGVLIGKMNRRRFKLAAWCIFPGLFMVVAGLVGPIYSSWFDFFLGSDPSLIQWGHLTTSSMFANGFTLAAFIIPLCVWTVRRSIQTNPTNHKHYARAGEYTLHSFSDEMGKHYPHVRLFRKINLSARSIDSGKYRMADTEKQFAMKHKLLDQVGKTATYKINSERAAGIFRVQLGKLWRNFNDLSRWEVAVMSVLVPRIAATDVDMPDDEYKRALGTTNKLIVSYWEEADRTYDTEADALTVDVSEGVATIRRYYKSPKVVKYFERHAYVYSILYAMLADARALGVLPSDEFRWLRVVDRRLWLVLNNVGRNTAFTEIAGLYCHYMHEIKKGRPMEKAEVNNAVKGLVEAIDGYRFSDDEIVKIVAQIKADEPAKTVIDPKAMATGARRLIMGSLRVRDGDKRDFLEVALLAENGDVVYAQRCRPLMSIEAIRKDFHLTDEEEAGLLKMPTSQEVKKKLIELANGQDVVAFYGAETSLVPGLDRSAASIRTLEDPDDGMDLAHTVQAEEIVKTPPSIRTAVDAAQLVRQLWVEVQKAEMRAAQASPGQSSGQ